MNLKGQAWYFNYNDYAKMLYLEGEASYALGRFQPFIGIQAFAQEEEGEALLGRVKSNVYGLQAGIRYNSLTASFGVNHIVAHSDAYRNGALVTPYAFGVSSGPLFAQTYLTSLQSLGAGNAYSINFNGALNSQTFLGARYSFMDTKNAPGAKSINLSELMLFGKYKFAGSLKGLSISNHFIFQHAPSKKKRNFLENRGVLEYVF